jgi:hypothetical protein
MHRAGMLFALTPVFVLGAAGCSRVPMKPDRDVVYMTSTFRALVEGLFEGEVSCGELTRHGDVGIGTFDGLDGEMAVVDGRVYQIKADGSVHEMAAARKTPYATVTPRVVGDLSPRVHLMLPENETFAKTDLTRASREEMNTIMGRKK